MRSREIDILRKTIKAGAIGDKSAEARWQEAKLLRKAQAPPLPSFRPSTINPVLSLVEFIATEAGSLHIGTNVLSSLFPCRALQGVYWWYPKSCPVWRRETKISSESVLRDQSPDPLFLGRNPFTTGGPYWSMFETTLSAQMVDIR